MNTRAAMKVVADRLEDELVVCTTGYTCRDMQALRDRPNNFYMIGSMGTVAAMGLGVALSLPDRTVVVFDGDGSLQMGLGILPMVGGLKPKNFIHLVFDNEVFASTGRQRTFSKSAQLEQMALAAGYGQTGRAETEEALRTLWNRFRSSEGPSLALIKCQINEGAPAERVRLAPEAICSRFMEACTA